MSDAPVEPEAVDPEVEKIVKDTKRGYDPRERLKGRALRKATVTVFTDEVTGDELGDAYDLYGAIGQKVGRERKGVLGELDQLEETKAAAQAQYGEAIANPDLKASDKTKLTNAFNSIIEAFDERHASLEERRDELIAELNRTGLTIKMKAVMPIIQKDTLRKARETCGITEKGIPEDRRDEVVEAQVKHLMTVMFQSVTDNETGDVSTQTTYEDAQAYKDMLPPSQWDLLDRLVGQLQFTDAISRSIEGQEDFS